MPPVLSPTRQVNCSMQCVNFPVGHVSLKIKKHQNARARALRFKYIAGKPRGFRVSTWRSADENKDGAPEPLQLTSRICNLHELSRRDSRQRLHSRNYLARTMSRKDLTGVFRLKNVFRLKKTARSISRWIICRNESSTFRDLETLQKLTPVECQVAVSLW